MIKYISVRGFDAIENHLLNHPDGEIRTTRFRYYLSIVGDCAGIFREGLVNQKATAKHPRIVKGHKELIAYYHEGEF